MNRQDCFSAINEVFPGVHAIANTDSWTIVVESTPRRVIVLADDFVEKNVTRDGMTPEAFRELIRSMPANRWYEEKYGNFWLTIHAHDAR